MVFHHPPARRADVVDTYHGHEVADPYRWLEDPDDPETQAFVAAQNEVSETYLRSLPERARLVERMAELWDTPRTDPPTRRGDTLLWTHNDGLADQAVFLVRRAGPDGELGPASVILDPNTLSDDGAVAVTTASLSPDGTLLAYTVSEGGSDRQRLRIRSIETGDDLDDDLRHLRFTSVAWCGDGFFYLRWPERDPSSTAPVRDPSVHYHRVGTVQADDPVVFHNDDDPDPSYTPVVSEDQRLLLLIETLGTDVRNGLLVLDLEQFAATDGAPPAEAWTRVADLGVAVHHPVHHDDGRLFLHTDRGARNGQVVAVDLAAPAPATWTTVVPEADAPIEWVTAVDGSFVVNRLVDASHRLDRFSPDGTARGTVDLPGLGSVTGISGRFDDDEFFVGYQSFVEPPCALVHRDGETSVFAAAPAALDPSTIVVERRHVRSSDGAEVGMFVVRRADLTMPAPVELYGYGGFSISLTPTYSPARLAFLEAGGVVAIANLRGGAEAGEAWHEQGMLGNKQQVFDDFVACARGLIDEGIATTATLGIRGGSNGGLLTAATMIQAPELFGAVVSQVPVTDMYRFQHFTAGRFWTVEYGDAADPEAFEWLRAYSPLHNVGDADRYPPLLVTTAEYDDRVVPMHSHKLVAELQYRAGGTSDQPILERVETRAGHGAGKPTSKLIEEAADIYAFLLHHLRP